MLITDATPLVVTPWFPTAAQPFAGAFVQQHADVLRRVYSRPPTVVHVDTFTAYVGNHWTIRAMQRAAESIAARSLRGLRLDGRTHRVPVVVHRSDDLAARAHAYERCARVITTAATGPVHVHAHVGLYAGVLAAALRPVPDRIMLYEHASFLGSVLTDPAAAGHYERAVAASAAITAVNPVAVEMLRKRFPEHEDRIEHVPNAVDFGRFETAAPVDSRLHRWIYLGNLKPEKGARKVLEVFLAACQTWPDLRLTIVGNGPDASWLRERTDTSTFADRVELVGARPADDVPQLLADHDLLVHLSESETFGLTAVEAVASGRPVLISSTNGSETTIRPIEAHVGRIVGQDAGVDEIVSDYGALRAGADRLDVEAGRHELAARYGLDAVADRIVELATQPLSRPEASDS